MFHSFSAALLLLAPTAPASAVAAPQEAEFTWRQDEPYHPPDFAAYFPEDPEGAAALDDLIDRNELRKLGDEEFLSTVHRGLRLSKNHRTSTLSWLGNRFIWGVDEQDPHAIEICYHAADFSEEAARFGTRHYAVYFGLSVVKEKTPSILRTLADLCVAIDDPNDIGRVAWGAADQMDQLMPYLQPHLESEDPYTKKKAEAVARIFRGEIGAFEWAKQRAQEPARPRPWREMPEVRATLRTGDSAARLELIDRIRSEGLMRHMNDSYIADFAEAAKDPDPEVRENVAERVGQKWIWGAGLHLIPLEAAQLEIELSRDPVSDVRRAAVYYGLSTYRGADDAVLERLVEMSLDPLQGPSHSRIRWGLEKYGERAKAPLLAHLEGENAQRAQAAYDVYKALFDERPPTVPEGIAAPEDLVGTWQLALIAPDVENISAQPLVIARDEAGLLTTNFDQGDELPDRLIGNFVSTEAGPVLHFSFDTLVDGRTTVRTRGRLEGDRIEGTTHIEGLDKLFVWEATRE